MSICAGSFRAYSRALSRRINASFGVSSARSVSCRQVCRPRCELTRKAPRRAQRKAVTPAGLDPPSTVHKTLGFFPSQTGRLIVIGDVHGCAVELAELLVKLKYKAGMDVLVFVGDLVNKGPRSRQVLQIAMQAGAHAVRGNHEELALAVYNELMAARDHTAWVNDLSADEALFMSEMPFTLSVEALDLLIVHAGMLPNVPKRYQNWRNLCTMRDIYPLIAAPNDTQTKYKVIATHRTGAKPPYLLKWAPLWKGPQHILFGHDAQQGLQKHTHATGLDTGCVYGGSLTACVIPIPKAVEVVSKLRYKTAPTFEDLGAHLVSVPARQAYLAVREEVTTNLSHATHA